MNTKYSLILGSVFLLIFVGLLKFFCCKGKHKMIYEVSNQDDLFALFPQSPEQIKLYAKTTAEAIDDHVKKIIEIPDDKRNFENTAKALDKIGYYYIPAHAGLQALELLSPNSDLRNAAHEEILNLTNYYVDNVDTNVKLYKAFKNYVECNSNNEKLNEEQKYFIDETLKDFKRSGLDLPEATLQKIRKLYKEIAEIGLKFETNIAQHKCEIAVTLSELDGLKEEFIDSLKKNKDSKYILGCDYPTYFNVMANCNVESTRKNLFLAFQNRAYPENIKLLNELVNKKDELAQLLGFKDYNHLALDGKMAKSPSVVYKFLNNLIDKAKVKTKNELNKLKSDLHESVKLVDGKFKPWDRRFVKSYYKKKYLNLDEQKVREYFPMEYSIKQLLSIYEKFLSLKFKEIPVKGFWHEDVKLIEAYDAHSNKLLGYLLLDLYPRDNKFSHAAHMTIIATVCKNGECTNSVGVVMANFPKPTKEHHSLLSFSELKTFFHEFGHAIHAILGCTEFYSFSGTNVKKDFVEMPSQMLEDWLFDKEILKMVSKHYETGEPLPDNLIDKILELEKFDSGDFILSQTLLSLFSMDVYAKGKDKNLHQLSKTLHEKLLNHVLWVDEDHFEASFGHLPSYGPLYYGYLWSKVFAKDLFYEIKKHGLLNPEIGQKYKNEVIGKGGSKDPNELLVSFLSRQPNQESFFKDMGLV